jgi:hypothetical protein
MKTDLNKRLTFGDLVAGTYASCSHRRAKAIVRFAVNTHLVKFRRSLRFVIS